VFGGEIEIFVKAAPPTWEGKNFFVIDRFKPSPALQAALHTLLPNVRTDAEGYLYIFDTTYQSELVRFKEPDYMLNTFRSIRNDVRMGRYLAEYQPSLVEVNDPRALDSLVPFPLIHVTVSSLAGKGRGALAVPETRAHWEGGLKPRLANHLMCGTRTHITGTARCVEPTEDSRNQ